MKQILLLLAVFLSINTYAQDGVLDNTFGTSGVATGYLNGVGTTATVSAAASSDITKIIVQPDGKIVQVGYKSVSGQSHNFIIIRYNENGSVDGPFGNNNPYGFTDHNIGGDDKAHGVALQSDGKIVVVGESTVSGESVIAVTRYTSTGAIDLTFGGGDGIILTDLTLSSVGSCGAYSVKIDASNDIYVVGWSKEGSTNDFVLLKYSGTDGSLITSFGSGGKITTDFASGNDAAADLVLGTSNIYVCGTAKSGTTDYFALASYTYAGALNAFFNGGTGKLLTAVPGVGRSLVVSDNIYMTGYSTGTPDFTTACYTLTGSINTSFGTNGDGVVRTDINNQDASRSILIQCDGKIVVGGELRTSSGDWYFAVVRYSATGVLDNTFGTGGKFSYNTSSSYDDFGYSGLAVQTSGKLLLGGISVTGFFSSSFHPRVIRLTNPSVVPSLIINNPNSSCSVDITLPAVTNGSATGLSYSYWTDALATIPLTNASAISTGGTYYIKGATSGGCYSVKPVVVSISSAPSGSISPASATICPSGSQLLTTSGGTSYQWSKDGTAIAGATSATYSATSAGTYSVMITNGSCSGAASNTSVITAATAPSASISPSGAVVLCPGQSQLYTASGSGTYKWFKDGVEIASQTSSTYTATTAGSYSVEVTTSCGSATSSASNLSFNASPSASISPSGAVVLCPGQSRLYTASGSGTYKWFKDGVEIASATASTYTATTAGSYSVEVTTSQGCTATSNSSVLQMASAPNGSVTSSSTIICPGSFINLTANGGSSYQWYLNGSIINGEITSSLKATIQGRYGAEIINSDGCKARASNDVVLTNASKPKLNFDFVSSCQNQPINFKNTSNTTGAGDVSWVWRFGDNSVSNSFSPVHNYKDPGTYTVTLFAQSNDCPTLSDSLKKSVVIKPAISGIRYPTVRTMKGKSYQLAARNIGTAYLWQPSTDLDVANSKTPVITPVQNREYRIKISGANGCVTTDTLLVQVLNKTEVFVPKAFTPNRNGVNDLLRPIVVNIPVIHYFKVYNRWGQLIFETKTLGEGWNGIYKGAAQPIETYTWIFEGRDTDGNLVKASGKTILIR